MRVDNLMQALKTFADVRDWNQFHSPKNFAMALVVEAGELLRPFMLADPVECRRLADLPEVRAYLEKEVGDVFINLVQLCRWCGLDARLLTRTATDVAVPFTHDQLLKRLMVQATQLMDPLQWADSAESRQMVQEDDMHASMATAVQDVALTLHQFCQLCDMDAEQAAWAKLKELDRRYAVDAVRARSARGDHSRVLEETGRPMFRRKA